MDLWQYKTNELGVNYEIRPCTFTPSTGAAQGQLFVEQGRNNLRNCSIAEACYLVGTLYTAMLPEKMRTKDGVFYTPLPYVKHLVEQSEKAGVNWASAKVFDPACGCGVFLIVVAQFMQTSMSNSSAEERLTNIQQNLRGMELDPFSAWLTQTFMEMLLLADCEAAQRRLHDFVVVADALTAVHAKDYDLVIGNPPYGKVTLDAAKRKRFARSLFGHANLYGLFTDLAVSIVKPGGVIALVTPTSFLGGQYFKALRSLMVQEAPPVSIDFVLQRLGVFDDALQETVLSVYRKTSATTEVHIGTVELLVSTDSRLEHNVLGDFAVQGEGPWMYPRNMEQARLISKFPSLTGRLNEMGFEVATGQLVWNRHKDQLRDSVIGPSTYPIIWAESVAAVGFSFSAAKRNHAPYITLTDGQDFLLTRDESLLVQRTTSKEQSRRLVAAVMPASFVNQHGGVVVENHSNIIRASVQTGLSLTFLGFMLNSRALDLAFRCISGSVAVSAYELENLPFPMMDEMLDLQKIWNNGLGSLAVTKRLDSYYGVNV